MKPTQKYLEYIAYEIRKLSLEITTHAGSGHPTSCLSAADLLSVLLFNKVRPQDHFILSKGHAAPALYAAYALLGCISHKELFTLREFNSPLEGHPTPRFPYTPLATGSLGQGLSVGVGILLAEKLKKSDARCYVLMGDSETAEGSVWEAIELAAHYKLCNLVAIIDANGLGQTTRTLDSSETYQAKFEAFGWDTLIIEGNSIASIKKAADDLVFSKPTCIIARTQKGYGLPSIQNKEDFHGKAFGPDELTQKLQELKKTFPEASSFAPGGIKPSILCQKKYIQAGSRIEFKNPFYEKGALIATRKAYGEALEYLGSLSNVVVALDAEVNNSTYANSFLKAFPRRFIQAFIAEQNMIGMACGLAIENFIPFCSTFAAFMTRGYDQLRMAAISRLPLRVVGSHAGVSVGQDGPSQMGLEDIALFQTLPDSVILYPCDAVSTYRCVELMANNYAGISYLRTTRQDTPVIYSNQTAFKIGGCHILKQSAQDFVTLITAGITLFEALKAYEQLSKENIFSTVIDCYSIKPLPVNDIANAAKKTGSRIIIIEDHYAAGGLGQALITALTEHDPKTAWNIKHLAVTKLPRSGKPEELLAYEDIDAQAIVNAVKKYL